MIKDLINNKIEKINYGKYSSDNYGVHTTAFKIGNLTFYFSYNTLVAVRGYDKQNNYVELVHKNEWGNTTGKHLNWINSNHNIRLNDEEFNKRVAQLIA